MRWLKQIGQLAAVYSPTVHNGVRVSLTDRAPLHSGPDGRLRPPLTPSPRRRNWR